MKVIPPIVSIPQLDLKCQPDRTKDVLYVYIDVEDGNFLLSITFGTKTVKEITAYPKAELDAHFLTTNPIKYIHELSESGISAACGHIEALLYPLEFLHEVCKAGTKAGLAPNLFMPIEQTNSYIGSFDYLLLMIFEPGSCDQRLWPCALERIRGTRACIPDEVMIYADDGIGRGELGKMEETGADCVIMGWAVQGAGDPARVWKEMETLNGYGTDSKAFRSL